MGEQRLQLGLAGMLSSLAQPRMVARSKTEFEMKLTEVSVDGYGVCNNLRLQNFSSGLNVVYGRHASGKSTLIRYIRNVFYGFGNQTEMGHGALEFAVNGDGCRLMRTVGTSGELVVSDLQGSSSNQEFGFVKQAIANLGGEVFDVVFANTSGTASDELARIANVYCSVPFGRQAAFGNASEVGVNESRILQCQSQLSTLDRRIAELEDGRQELNQRIDELEFSYSGRAGDVEAELKSIADQLQDINVTRIKTQIQTLDLEISELQNRIEVSKQVVPISHSEPTGLAELYLRLDEIDDQIRRWRQIHTDIQQQRIELKNEMVVWNETSMASAKHPYHRAQEIVTAIETKVGMAEQSVGTLQNVQIVTPENNALTAERLSELCSGIRQDLYELCDELSGQFKQIRHRAAASELKRLRRCYEEIGDNIQIMIERRESVITQIRNVDPEGARLIDRQEQDFCRCASHDGYLQARRRFGGPVEMMITHRTPTPNVDAEVRRLGELRTMRGQRVNELVDSENCLSRLEARRQELLAQQHQISNRRELDELKMQFQRSQDELTGLQQQRLPVLSELQQLQRIQVVPANSVLLNASSFVDQMTRGSVQHIWLEDSGISSCGIVVEERSGATNRFEALPHQQKHAVGLSLRLAIANDCSKRFGYLPVLVDDAFDGMDEVLTSAILESMVEFCRGGNQLIAFTSNRSAVELSRRRQVLTMDLPETSVSPVRPNTPIWTPERIDEHPPREPEFLTPYTTRMHHNLHRDMSLYPQVKYPPTGQRFDHRASSFDQALPAFKPAPTQREATLVETVVLTEASSLESIGIFDSMEVERLNRLGVTTASQLLAVDPDELPRVFIDSHITGSQLDQWQALAWMLICVPGLKATDARILFAIGVNEPEQLETTNSAQLVDRINRFLRSADGQSFSTLKRIYDRDLANRWYDALNRTRSNWRMASGYSRRRRHRSRTSVDGFDRGRVLEQNNRSRDRADRQRDRNPSRPARQNWRPERETRLYEASANTKPPRGSASASRETKTVKVESSPLKFYLELSDDLEAAPSIGPKTAERFIKIGVKTIAEFLTQTADSMASKINYKRITAEVIRQWQHQSRMVCRVPNLRGHDAQLLVACGITEPEDLADRQPQNLFKIIEPFAKSKDGLKIIRGGKQPDLEEVTDWINWARETRSLQAA